MSVKDIEIAITQLQPSDVSELASWVVEYHQNLWDEQIEDDLESGRLDALLAEVDAEYEAALSRSRCCRWECRATDRGLTR